MEFESLSAAASIWKKLSKLPTIDEFGRESTIFLSIFRPKVKTEKGELYYTLSINYAGKKEMSPIVPAEEIIVDSKMRGDIIDKIKGNEPNDLEELKSIGRCIYFYFLSDTIRVVIKLFNPEVIIITTNDGDIPWELTYDGTEFWALKHQIGRFLGEVIDPSKAISQEREKSGSNKLGKEALIISRPTIDLKDAVDISTQLKLSLDTLLGEKKTMILEADFASKLRVFDLFCSGKFSIIYYYGHAKFNDADPSHSSLILSDGSLCSYEIDRISWELIRPIIFLNGCETATNKYLDGRNLGIAKSFLEAGAISVIGTLWPIYDVASEFFTRIFYENILKGKTVGASLREAKIKTNIRYQSPKYWAPYILFGAPSKVLFIEQKKDKEILQIESPEVVSPIRDDKEKKVLKSKNNTRERMKTKSKSLK